MKNKESWPSVSILFFIGCLAAYFALVLNFSFLVETYRHLAKEQGNTLSMLFYFMTIPIFLYCIFISLFSLIAIKPFEKIIFIVLTLIASILSYAYIYYGLLFDDHSPIIGTIEQTNFKEITPLINFSFVTWLLCFGVLPSFLIYKAQLTYPPFWKKTALRCVGILIYPLFYFTVVLSALPVYHTMFRLSGLAARLPFQLIPTNFFENFFHYYKDKIVSRYPYKEIGLDVTHLLETTKDGKNNLLVMVIGESARSMTFGLNGYHRETNPYTKHQSIISFRDITSCGTSTRISVPCIFSNLKRKNFNGSIADHQDNLLDILKRGGLNLLWIDNNGPGDCQGVCKHIKSVITHGQDGIVIEEFAHYISLLPKKDTVIVLHLQGSHGNDYYTKYPSTFRKFTPDCQKNELRFCDKQSLINAYDNTIVYTDFVLNELIKILQAQHAHWKTALMYTSDHGESVGEHGLYGHCAPYWIAPTEQTQVPLMFWFSQEFQVQKNISTSCLQQKTYQKGYSHDNLFHSILGLLDMNTSVYKSQLDLFKSCRKDSSSMPSITYNKQSSFNT